MKHKYEDKAMADRMAEYYCAEASTKTHLAELIEQSVRARVLDVLNQPKITDEQLVTVATDIKILLDARDDIQRSLTLATEAQLDALSFETETNTEEKEKTHETV